MEILGKVNGQLPFEVMTSRETREDLRLKYRFLDLRNRKVMDNMVFRSRVIAFCGKNDADGIFRGTDPDSVRVVAGRGEGLYRTFEALQGKILCAAPGASAV